MAWRAFEHAGPDEGRAPVGHPAIRPANTAEAALLSRFLAQAFLDAQADEGDRAAVDAHLRREFGAAVLSVELADPARVTLVAGHATGYAGVAQIALAGRPPASVMAARPAELHRFYAARSFHGSGLAVDLMDEIIRQARDCGADLVWLRVWQRSARAVAFFRRYGFTVVGSDELPMGDKPLPAWIMALPVAR